MMAAFFSIIPPTKGTMAALITKSPQEKEGAKRYELDGTEKLDKKQA